MKIQRYIAVLLLLAFMVVGASAYGIWIDAPQSLKLGETIVVNGTTSLPGDVPIDITLTRSENMNEVKSTKHVILRGDKNFTVEFPTTGYTRGEYKVEALYPSKLGSDSRTMRVVILIDRSEEIILTPPLQKVYDGFLTIAGNGAGLINSGVKVIVTSSNGTLLFGPEFIASDYMGYFSKKFPIQGPGNYSVNFSDAHGFIGNFTYTITKHQETQTTPITPTPTPTPNSTVSATSVASRDKPAIFVVFSNPGPVLVYTSTGIDWDLEYLDRNGTIHKVHETGSQYPESVTFPSDGNTTRVTVYPNRYEDNNKNVTLNAENATDIQILNTTPPTPTSTPKSSLQWLLFIVAIGLSLMIKRR